MITDFTIEYLDYCFPDYFMGYGVGPDTTWDGAVVGTGATEKEALDDAIEQLALELDCEISDALESHIRTEYGPASDQLERLYEDCVDGEYPNHYVGIKYRSTQA